MRSHVDLPTLDALQAEWREHPPVHHLVAAYLSYKPPIAPGTAEHDKQLQDLMSLMRPAAAAPTLDAGAWDRFTAEPRKTDDG